MLLPYKAVVFIVVSAGMVWLSRYSLRNLRSHGFYRFFAWEAILVLVLINAGNWFRDPFSLTQIASWLLLTVSAWLVGYALVLFWRLGKPSSERKDPSLFGIEKTTVLVTAGIYRYIRHPMYSALLFGAWGVFFKQPSIPGAALASVATFFLIMTARMEEAENICFFGVAYQTYMKQSKMFVPFLF